MRKKLDKYYIVINSKTNRIQGAFPLSEKGEADAAAYIKFLERKNKQKGVFTLVKK